MVYSTICGIDASAYHSSQIENRAISRVEYHCERCGQRSALIAVRDVLTVDQIHDQETCECGCNGVVIDAVFVGTERVPRQESEAA